MRIRAMVDPSEISKGLFRWTGGRFEQAVPPDWYVRAFTEGANGKWPGPDCSRVTAFGELLEIEVYDTPDGERYVIVGDAAITIWESLVAPVEWPHFFRAEILPLIDAAARMTSAYHMDRLSTATIAVGRHGLGTDLDEYSGHSRRDQWAERQRTLQARERLQAKERRA
jgi:hypothetical protein